MSDTIQARQYTPRQATLLQQHPSELIETAESVVDALEDSYVRSVHMLYDPSSLHGVNVNIIDGVAAARGRVTSLTAGTTVVVANTSWPTTTLEVFVAPDEYQTENIWTRWTGLAKEALQKAALTTRRQTTAAARWRVERLSTLQASFGFTIQDLAVVLGITRPQLYKWLDAANDIKLQEASRARLATIEHLAKEWSARTKVPLNAVSKEPLAAGGTVFALMSADEIDNGAVGRSFDELMTTLGEKPKSRSQRLRDAGFTRRPSVRSLPSDE